ncbi:MAG: hypothetical protein AB2421_19445 [Thermotaleaceae bacterium]
MKSRSIFAFAVTMIMILILSACSNSATLSDISAPPLQSSGQIYLYGEVHGVDKILDKEFELWYEYYHNQSMRHLFVELPYYTAEFLNIWMQSDSNDILDTLYSDWAGTANYKPNVKEFYEKIKSQCPETIFHGTDVGHQYNTTGERFLEYLRSNNLEDSEQYLLTNEIIEQGKHYYRQSDDVYRENMMVGNFIHEFDKLSGESIMGIYGAAHTGLEAMNYTNSVPCMANQLKERYGDTIRSEDLSSLAKDIEPYRVDTIQVRGKEYEAMYFGKQDLIGFEDYAYREFWRLENAYDDFMDRPKAGDVLPYNNYPMLIETGQVFVIDYTKADGSVIRMYYRSDGYVWNNTPSTEEFKVE